MTKRKLLLNREQRPYKEYYIADPAQNFHTAHGMITKKDLAKKPGSTVKTNTGKRFLLLDTLFADDLKRIKRLPQTMSPKDIGLIITATGIGKDSTVIDAGSGSGATACNLARMCKNVITYDIEQKHVALTAQNATFLGLANITAKKGNIYQKIPEKNADLFVLDVPMPWKALTTAAKSLKIGGFIAAYTLQASQLQQFVNALNKDKRFLFLKSAELIERLWKVEGKIVRPHNIPIGHTGFLTFARKVC